MTITMGVCDSCPSSLSRPELRELHRAFARARAEIIRAGSQLALLSGPLTTREIGERIGPMPFDSKVWTTHADGEILGEHSEGIHLGTWTPTDEVRRQLVKLEREGVLTRLVLPGAQSHLWALVNTTLMTLSAQEKQEVAA